MKSNTGYFYNETKPNYMKLNSITLHFASFEE